MNRILIVDDDLELCELLSKYLRGEGFEVDLANDGRSGVEQALSGDHALVVLDVMLPELNGFEALRLIRSKSSLPVLMLTARGDDVDRIVGLEMGADDYLQKPFNPRELIARIRAILRRSQATGAESFAREPEKLVAGDVELDKGTRIVTRSGEQLALTTVEFDLLEALIRSAGRIVSREDLVKSILGRNFSPYDRSIDTHISNLRKKLGHRADGVDRIKTIRGVGYIYAKAGDPARET
jgi:two-component system response regulator CpxR